MNDRGSVKERDAETDVVVKVDVDDEEEVKQ
jgi:hypothetical protein